jgi:hypothetical protein
MIVAGAAALAAAGVLPTLASAADAVTATFTVDGTKSDGYNGIYTVRNTGGSTLKQWSLTFKLPSGTTVEESSGAELSNEGATYTANSTDSLEAGASTDVGFTAAGTGQPTSCTINSNPCDEGGTPDPTPTEQASSPSDPDPTPTGAPSDSAPPPSGADVIEVSTAEELTAALSGPKAGVTISLAAGSYEGKFIGSGNGTAEQPISVVGPRSAVLSSSSGSGYGLSIDGGSFWRLTGFSVANAAKGIVFDKVNNSVIDGVEVSQIGAEAVHFRTNSSDNVIRNSLIHDTGLEKPQFGEGIYFGTAKSNWSEYGENGGPDHSDRNQALDNTLGPNITAEHFDIKEGTVDGLIKGNTMDGSGISAEHFADSWLDMKGTGYEVSDNTGTYSGDKLANGFEVHMIVDGAGCGNVFRGNKADLGGSGAYGFFVEKPKECASNPNVIYSSNTVSQDKSGLANVPVTDG